MKKRIIGISLVAIFALVASWNSFQTKNNDRMSDLLLSNVEALAGLGEWWDSKVYTCSSQTCTITFLFYTYYGTYEQCLDGSDVAHCWNCKMCDA
ncbi:hypothetical protein D0T50_01830 [Bacteroides sp. 214]|uniref:NVEALA domain-containing protein n=1 Tax=Bacteroides sp. 214 TaxID=2302935 RepID=UPI0013D17DE3|nr:NVEALA domain-containing protein [Bacteroides sp. 214]NDW11626.1 hypothetical protein [Bacteroides sp. 214]